MAIYIIMKVLTKSAQTKSAPASVSFSAFLLHVPLVGSCKCSLNRLGGGFTEGQKGHVGTTATTMGCRVSSHVHIRTGRKARGTTCQRFGSDWHFLRLHFSSRACFLCMLSTPGRADSSAQASKARTFALTLPFPAGKWLNSSLPSHGRFCGCPQIWKRIGVFSQEHTIKSEKVPGNKSPCLSAKEEPGAASSVNIQPLLSTSRRFRWRSRKTIPLRVTAREAKALNLLEAENKLAALPASSWPSERSLLSTPALQTVLLADNTCKDIKTFPSAYCLSRYWLDWLLTRLTELREIHPMSSPWAPTWAWTTWGRQTGRRTVAFKVMG